MTKMEYIYHTDAAHGWLRVNITELQRLNLMNKITPYSYRLGNYAYLEEDADASKFINKKKQLNEKYTIKEKDDGNYSPIRGYPPFANPTISPSHHASKRKKGWRMESARHSLARKGIETGRKKKVGSILGMKTINGKLFYKLKNLKGEKELWQSLDGEKKVLEGFKK